MKCFSCSADVSPQTSQCEYCDSYVEPTPPPTMTKRIDDWRNRIFAAIKDSPQFRGTARSRFRKRLAAKFATRPEPGVAELYGVSAVALCIVLAVIGGPLCLVPAAIFVVGAITVGLHSAWKNANLITTSPRARLIPAIVVDKREETRGQKQRLTCRFVTVELEDGRRQELSVWDPSLYQRLAHDQAGVLFRRGQVATNFQCVPVSRSMRGPLQLT